MASRLEVRRPWSPLLAVGSPPSLNPDDGAVVAPGVEVDVAISGLAALRFNCGSAVSPSNVALLQATMDIVTNGDSQAQVLKALEALKALTLLKVVKLILGMRVLQSCPTIAAV
ncbi:MAG: hypothetical protein FJ146_15640 [Deltaproteobacteria bacterium]|nr:hypothetical protein [Deltaproteobacteria bacterium]